MKIKQTISNELYSRAQKVIPGGVNSPVRSFKNLNCSPIFFDKAKGSYVYDVDGNKYIDYVGSWGPMILGHNDDDVIKAMHNQLEKSVSFGAPCKAEILLAEKICKMVPSVEQIRFVNSGTEATMSAIRLARAFTKKDKIIKFEGCYHGHADDFLVAAGSGGATFSVSDSLGVPNDSIKNTLIAEYNNILDVVEIFKAFKDEIACVIIEPIAGNMNLVFPKKDFLQQLSDICKENNALLIFDEVMTGFRVSSSGAQEIYKINPDLTTFGKIIGGGMPVGAFGGRKDIMQMVSPVGSVYQAGTLSGNPLAMIAGLETLSKIDSSVFFEEITAKTKQLADGLNNIGIKYNKNFHAKSIGAMFGIFFNKIKDIQNFKDASNANFDDFKNYFTFMLENGVYFAPSQYEAGFMSITHSDQDIQKTISLSDEFWSTHL